MKDNVLNILDNVYEAKDLIEINDMLGLTTPDELNLLKSTLDELVEENLIYYTKKEKYMLLKNCSNLKIGKLSVNKKGFGFVILKDEEDIYIDKNNLNEGIDEDLVLCEIIDKGIKREGRIIKIIKRELKNLVGTIKVIDDTYYLDLDDKKDITVELNKDTCNNLVDGHKVLVSIDKELGNKKYIGSVVSIIGHKDDPGIDIMSIAYKYGFFKDFSDEVKSEVEKLPSSVSDSELKDRRDLTNEVIFTIDGSHTKDIDDAISLTRNGDNYVLGVHIADVSNYVKENTFLGNSAYERGTSCYLADTVIPMLPHELSNGICSLNEGVIRLTMSCVMEYDPNGKLISYDIFPSYIKSRKKMTYEKVNDILMRDIVDPEYAPFSDTLKEMNKLAHILRKVKIKRGYIDFEIPEASVLQDENGLAIDVVKDEREDGEKLIEDFMIAANETVASHIYNMDLPFIYRVHEQPKEEKIEEFMTMLSLLGLKKHKINDFTPKDMQLLLEDIKGNKMAPFLSSMLLRSMRKAEYLEENIGHFGLASKAYTHFTSPIRRYPDLVVHRLLKKYLIEKDFSMTTINTLTTSLVEIASHSSEREQASVNAERDVFDMKVAEYMESHIGEEYDGVISSITNFGFFVELPNLIEGLVHVNSLKGDYYNYVPELLSMVGKSTKKRYMMGDNIRIKCVGASKEASTVDFEIVGDKDGNRE